MLAGFISKFVPHMKFHSLVKGIFMRTIYLRLNIQLNMWDDCVWAGPSVGYIALSIWDRLN